jgi:hypothetical protein
MAKEFYEARNPSMKWSALTWWEKLHMAVLAEREACAKLCDANIYIDGGMAQQCAAEIRARGERS